MKLFVDTREQAPLDFKVGGMISEVINTKLPYGDYFGGWEDKAGNFVDFFPVCFERKSLGDLFGTLGKGMERFKREIARAKEDKFQLIIIVEGCLEEVRQGHKYSKMEGESILKTLFTLWVKHDVIHIFCNDRRDMKRTIIEMFSAVGRNFKPSHTKLAEAEVAHEKRSRMEEAIRVEEERAGEESGGEEH